MQPVVGNTSTLPFSAPEAASCSYRDALTYRSAAALVVNLFEFQIL